MFQVSSNENENSSSPINKFALICLYKSLILALWILGTGKTLVAGALASEINREGIGKVSFFQRKGADILDKWVGESEKNLRTLFEKVRTILKLV